MDRELFGLKEALLYLENGVVVRDINFNYYKKVNDLIIIKGENISCKITISEFKELFKDMKFFLDSDSEEMIDSVKDEEYYNFKHK